MSSKNSISFIFRPMKFSMKYFAFNTLFGLFADEWNSPGRTGIVCRTLSTLYFFIYMIVITYMLYVMYYVFYVGEELPNFVYNVVTLVGSATLFFVSIFMQWVGNQRLADYIQFLRRLEPLLEPRRTFLRRNINCAYFGVKTCTTSVYIYMTIVFSNYVHGDNLKILNSEELFYLFMVVVILTLQFPLNQPLIIFVSFHHVLKHCFEELALQIRRDLNTGCSQEMADKLRKYRRLHLAMFEACVKFDEMLHPVVFILYVLELVYVVAQFSMAFSGTSADSTASFHGGIFFLNSLLALTAFAQMTTTSSVKLVHSVFDSFDFTDRNVLHEMESFKLQLLCLKHTFSASKFFALNGDLILSILQSVISYTVIFFKVCKASMP